MLRTIRQGGGRRAEGIRSTARRVLAALPREDYLWGRLHGAKRMMTSCLHAATGKSLAPGVRGKSAAFLPSSTKSGPPYRGPRAHAQLRTEMAGSGKCGRRIGAPQSAGKELGCKAAHAVLVPARRDAVVFAVNTGRGPRRLWEGWTAEIICRRARYRLPDRLAADLVLCAPRAGG